MNVRSLCNLGHLGNSKRLALLAGALALVGAGQASPALALDRLVPSQYATIQAGIDAAQNGDNVLIANGTYRLTSTLNFKGKAINVRSATGYAAQCIINASAVNGPAVLFNSGENENSALRLVQIIGGFGSQGGGGGIQCVNSSPAITSCLITKNRSTMNGGGINCLNSSPYIIGCTFSENSAPDSGGAIFNDSDSVPFIVSCTFTGNRAKFGGAIASHSTYGPSTLVASAIIGSCTFQNNVADWFGGAIDSAQVNLDIQRCSFNGNSAGNGGAVSNRGSITDVMNCVFSGNRGSGSGSAMFNMSGLTNVTNCTLTNNASSTTTPIAAVDASTAVYKNTTRITNCILFGNPGGAISMSHAANIAPEVLYSNVQGGFAGEGNISVDPRFVRNPSAGADGIWNTADDNYGDLHLQSVSFCINRGLNPDLFPPATGGSAYGFVWFTSFAITSPGDYDRDTHTRIMGGRIDMGAYEFLQ